MRVLVECKADKLLVEKLGFKAKHIGSKPEIAKILRNSQKCVALIDEDPHSRHNDPYFQYLQIIENKYDVTVRLDKRRKHYIVSLTTNLEDWIIKVVKNMGKNMRDYNLPDDVNSLHRRINYNLKKFDFLLDDIIESDMVRYLKKKIEDGLRETKNL